MPNSEILILPDAVLENLYGNSLYNIEQASDKPAKKERPAPVKKLMSIITAASVTTENDPDAYNFIAGVIKACRIPFEEVSFFYSDKNEINFKYVQDNANAPLVIMFEIKPGEIGLPVFFPHFQLQLFSGVTYLSAPDLSTIQQDKLLKSKLWLCLKQHFSI